MMNILPKRMIIILFSLAVLITITSAEIAEKINRTSKEISTTIHSQEIIHTQYVTGKDENILINYPQISGIRDHKMQAQINALILEEILKRFQDYEWDRFINDINYLKVTYDIKWHDEQLLSIQYYEDSLPKMRKGNSSAYTTNINLTTGQKIIFRDIFKVNADFIKQWRKNKTISHSYAYGSNMPAKQGGSFDKEIDRWEDEELLKQFGQEAHWGESDVRFYFTKDILGIWLYPFRYVDFQTKYQDITDYIKDKQDPIWHGLSL